MEEQEKTPLTKQAAGAAVPVRSYLFVLAFGLLPLAGILLGILWGYGPGVPGWKRNLARALLWLHGIALALLVVALFVWVVLLLGTHPFV